jgi:hypothetical protein
VPIGGQALPLGRQSSGDFHGRDVLRVPTTDPRPPPPGQWRCCTARTGCCTAVYLYFWEFGDWDVVALVHDDPTWYSRLLLGGGGCPWAGWQHRCCNTGCTRALQRWSALRPRRYVVAASRRVARLWRLRAAACGGCGPCTASAAEQRVGPAGEWQHCSRLVSRGWLPLPGPQDYSHMAGGVVGLMLWMGMQCIGQGKVENHGLALTAEARLSLAGWSGMLRQGWQDCRDCRC